MTPGLTKNNTESWLSTVWEALHCFREDCIPESDPIYDEQWDDVCTAMAWIREELGLPDEFDTE